MTHSTAAEIEALSFGIFAIHTLQHPGASSISDLQRLDERADDVMAVLTALRDRRQHVSAEVNHIPGLCGQPDCART